jgi:HSP20 family molecular chaperone IbpA
MQVPGSPLNDLPSLLFGGRRRRKTGRRMDAGLGVRRLVHPRCLQEDVAMRNYDFAPLSRSTVGFDRVFDLLDSAFTAAQGDEGYPPYNIVKTGETSYRIELAVAGFGPDELSIVSQENVLTVAGSKNSSQQQLYLHHGIASRAFERRFNLADCQGDKRRSRKRVAHDQSYS